MKKIILYGLFLSIALLVSCVKEDDFSADTIYKDEILDYLSAYKEIVPSGQIEKIDELISSLDFKRVNIHQLRTTESVIIANLKTMSGFNESNNLKALFFVNEGKIVRSNIADFDSKTPTNEYDKLILSVLNTRSPKLSYSGKVSLFNLYRELILFNGFENGVLNAVGFTRQQKSGKKNGRTDSCTDWYLVTYYPNGNVTSQYVFTTCDNGCQFYRMGRTNCGGGGGAGYASGGGPVLPANPINGATYEYTDKNGEYTKYQYDAASAIWKIVEKILPAAVVVAKRDEYPFLDLDWPGAYHGQIVLGTDNMMYTFGSDGNWHGVELGDKPISEYSNKCQGLQDIWNNNPNNEMYGYITSDGKLIVTNRLPVSGGAAFGTFKHPNGTTYYPYPMSQSAPSQSYSGMIQYPASNPTHYLIPVVASVHTHSPCRSDGTNGVSHAVGSDDTTFAASHPELRHWIIGCGAIAQFNGTNSSFFNVQSGNISSTCNSIN
jgi:hypothetical protein